MLKTKKSIAVRYTALLCAILIGSCCLVLAQDVKYNYAEGTDFTKFKTYKWTDVHGGTHPDPLINDQIIAAIDSQLALKGLTKSDSEKVDMLVDYQVAVTQETQWTASGMRGGVRYGGGMGTATSSAINIGTLVVDLYDAAAEKLVWRGDATKTLNPSKDPEKNKKNLNKAVEKLMKKYPPKVKD